MEKIAYGGWDNCYRLSNGMIELVVTGDVGPRIIRLASVGGENLFKEFAETLGKTGGDQWHSYGGHRLWLAPEVMPGTYYPDNEPVKAKETKKCARFTPPVETTGIQKEIDIGLSPDKPHARVTHRVTNAGSRAVDLAPWALSVMAEGGKVIMPHPPRGKHPDILLPTHTMTIWAFTDMTDPRWTWGFKYVMLQQDVKAQTPQKVGVMVSEGWCACAVRGDLFVKTFDYSAAGVYPDFGCTVETFTNNEMIELETVAPMVTLQPGASVEHVEDWYLFKDMPAPKNDADVEKLILPKIAQARE